MNPRIIRLVLRQLRGIGVILAAVENSGLDCRLPSAARRFCDQSRIFLLPACLCGVESLIVLPIYTFHNRRSTVELAAAGVGPGTIRMSMGLQNLVNPARS